MISSNCLSIDWISKVSARKNKADKILVEKVIRSLHLLEGLVETKLDFIFKGGTALMLLLDAPGRLSIDVDIIMEEKTDLKISLDEIIKNKGFTRYELQDRKANTHIDKAH